MISANADVTIDDSNEQVSLLSIIAKFYHRKMSRLILRNTPAMNQVSQIFFILFNKNSIQTSSTASCERLQILINSTFTVQPQISINSIVGDMIHHFLKSRFLQETNLFNKTVRDKVENDQIVKFTNSPREKLRPLMAQPYEVIVVKSNDENKTSSKTSKPTKP